MQKNAFPRNNYLHQEILCLLYLRVSQTAVFKNFTDFHLTWYESVESKNPVILIGTKAFPSGDAP